MLDLIIKSKDPYTCISQSDLSIAQQGIVFDDVEEQSLHITPLSLYTYYTKKIIVTIAPLSRKYEYSGGEFVTSTEEYYYNHKTDCPPCMCSCGYTWSHKLYTDRDNCIQCGAVVKRMEFHQCYFCSDMWNKEDEQYNYITKWLERIQKYEKRFPDYELIYVDVPIK